jgi:hypothetical protein
MAEQIIQGSCLCGEVMYQFTGPIKVFQYCHCSRCQKFTGSAHAANIIIDPEHFKWLSGEDTVGRYELKEAKHFATSFCRNCGSSLPWLTQSKKAYVIPAGTLDEDPQLKPMHNIYYADKAAWYVCVDELIKYDALPV